MKTFEQWLGQPEIIKLELSGREITIARLGWTSACLAKSDQAVAEAEQKLKALG